MTDPHPQHLSPLLGKDHRETMHKVSTVLAFISRGMEACIDVSSSNGKGNTLGDYNDDELYGLRLICRTLTAALEYEPPPTMPLG